MSEPTSLFDSTNAHAAPEAPPRSLLSVLGLGADTPPSARAARCFTEAEAHALVAQLRTTAQLKLDGEGTRYLVALFRTLPFTAGDALQVIAAHDEPIAEALEKDVQDKSCRSGPQQAVVLLTTAAARAAEPQAQPWIDVQAVLDEKKRQGPGDSTDAEKDYARFLNKVLAAGLLRRRQTPVSPTQFMGLRDAFPNFAAPIRFLAEQSALSTLSGAAFQPPPMLLTGPAGVGKTRFAEALAALSGARYEVLNIASQSCGFTLAGMDRGWSSARPGMVFSALMHGETLAPVILLDEIDKSNADGRSNPLGPLYTLLEPGTARSFRDEYAGLPVDASQVVWLATANDAAALPQPLLSRFKVFDIPMPTDAELLMIATAMLRTMTAGLPAAPHDLPLAWRARLPGHSVRDVRSRLQEALGRAALRAVSAGVPGLRFEDDDWVAAAPTSRRPMGFS